MTFFMIGGAVLYLGAAIMLYYQGHRGMGLAYFCYAISNLALLWEALSK